MTEPLDLVRQLLADRFPACAMRSAEDGASCAITAAGREGAMRMEVMVHHPVTGALSCVRFKRGTPQDGSVHFWTFVDDAAGETLHFEVTCCLNRLGSLIGEWLEPERPFSSRLVLPATENEAAKVPASGDPTVLEEVDASILQTLPEPQAALQALAADIARIDRAAVLRHWPRDAQGRLALRATALLNAYGPPTRKRQPCLILVSASAQRRMPEFRLTLSQEFLYNHRWNWKDAPWLWAAQHAPNEAPEVHTVRRLLSQGLAEDACDMFGVRLGDGVRRLAEGKPFGRFMPNPPAWREELHTALRSLAPWQMRDGLAHIQAYLAATNKKPPKQGSWERKLFWFSKQTQQAKFGLAIGQGENGAPELRIIATASNEHFPEPDWRDVSPPERLDNA